MEFKISPAIRHKLSTRHNVTAEEVYECFMNREGPSFTDDREDHQTTPPTYWFLSETDCGRLLKVIYVQHPDHFAIKSAYEANGTWIAHYAQLCGN